MSGGRFSPERSFLPNRIYLIDQAPRLVVEWKERFAEFLEIVPLAGDYFQQPADAIVSPANSFGIMDGGLDLAIRNQLGYSVELKLQERIVERHHGELPIGCAEIVETRDSRWKYLIAAPTMRVPEAVAYTLNAFLAFRAILVAVEQFNRAGGAPQIESVVCSGLGTGVGGMTPARCATQMRIAYLTMLESASIPSFKAIHDLHNALRLS